MKSIKAFLVKNFKAPFVAAEGWGSFNQVKHNGELNAELHLKYGKLRIRTLSVETSATISKAVVLLNGKGIEAAFSQSGSNCIIRLSADVNMAENQKLAIVLLS